MNNPTEYKKIEYVQRKPLLNGKVERTASGKIVISCTVEGARTADELGQLLTAGLKEVRLTSSQLQDGE